AVEASFGAGSIAACERRGHRQPGSNVDGRRPGWTAQPAIPRRGVDIRPEGRRVPRPRPDPERPVDREPRPGAMDRLGQLCHWEDRTVVRRDAWRDAEER